MVKPVLVGTDNPHSVDPEDALSPHPYAATGWRIWKMLNERTGATEKQYMRRFQRCNVTDLNLMTSSTGRVVTPDGLARVFRRAGQVVLLGDQVRRYFGLPRVLLHPIARDGVTYRQVPHPSGLNRFYNCPAQRALVAALLEELYHG